MRLLGITGGVGMGKSTVASLLLKAGASVIDTDEIARSLVQSGSSVLGEIVAAFGSSVLKPDGSLNRGVLAEVVFKDPDSRKRLEAILHPRIRECWLTSVRRWRADGVALGVVVIPLLYETHAEGEFDQIICVACSSLTQLRRLGDRGWPPEQIASRIAAQWPVADKMARADFVIWSDCPVKLVDQQLDRILRR